MQVKLAFINDEVGPSLDAAIAFARANHVASVEMRSVGGVNLALLPLEEIAAIAARLREAGLRVPCLAAPLLKWLPAGRAGSAGEADQHGFVRDLRPDAVLFDHVFAAADLLGAPLVRIFAYLRYDGFDPDDLAGDYAALLDRARRHDKVLVIENEPPSNAGSIDELVAVLERWHEPRLGALLDIANACEVAAGSLDDRGRRRIARFVRHIHCKDFDAATGARRPVGQGSVPYGEILPPLLEAIALRPLTLSIETHMPASGAEATAASLAYLRRLLASAEAARA